jgi:hypothetical protein
MDALWITSISVKLKYVEGMTAEQGAYISAPLEVLQQEFLSLSSRRSRSCAGVVNRAISVLVYISAAVQAWSETRAVERVQ